MQVYHLVPDVLRRFFGLGRGGEDTVYIFKGVDRCLRQMRILNSCH